MASLLLASFMAGLLIGIGDLTHRQPAMTALP
jgi:hypothetical protein